MANQTASTQLYDLLVTKNFELQALDGKTGRAPVDDEGNPDISRANEFRFDFVPESGRNYGSVVIMLGDDKELLMFFGDNIGKSMETEDKTEWFELLQQLKRFATKNFMSFTPQNISKLKYSKQSRATVSESLQESWQGKGNISWNGQPTEARIVIKHSKSLNEDEARFRFIECIYIETADRERFKLKSRSLTAAKAMLEHVRHGGNPYDARAQHINEIVEELSVLSRFRRANANRVLEGDTKNLVEQTNSYYKNMHSVLKHLGTNRGYQAYFESWTPNEVNEGNLVVEDLKQLFVEQTIDHRIEEALPLLARITQEANAMKEAQIFESWVNNLVEGTWALPETPEQKQTLVDLMSKEFPVGADATNATEQLYDIFGDDVLFDQLQELADANADADARSVVLTRMEELSGQSPDVEAVLGQLQTTNPAEPIEPTADAEELGQEVAGDEQLPQSVEEGREDEATEFYVYIGSEDAGQWIGSVVKDGGKWREMGGEGTKPHNWGTAYMSYLTPDEVMQWIRQDYRRGYTVEGPFYSDAEVYDYAEQMGFEDDDVMEGADERKQNALWAQITAHEKAAKQSKDLKQQHHLKMADQLRSQLKTSDNVEEGQCNMTEAGEYCPKHGLEECGIMEYTGNWTNFGLEESDALSQLKKLAHGK